EISRGWRDFQGAVGRVENLGLVFHSFHGPGISTALLRLNSIRRRTVPLGPRDLASNASLAFCICCAASVSLIRIACRCSIGAVLAFHQSIVSGPVGPRLGELDQQLFQQLSQDAIDKLRTVVAVEAE